MADQLQQTIVPLYNESEGSYVISLKLTQQIANEILSGPKMSIRFAPDDTAVFQLNNQLYDVKPLLLQNDASRPTECFYENKSSNELREVGKIQKKLTVLSFKRSIEPHDDHREDTVKKSTIMMLGNKGNKAKSEIKRATNESYYPAKKKTHTNDNDNGDLRFFLMELLAQGREKEENIMEQGRLKGYDAKIIVNNTLPSIGKRIGAYWELKPELYKEIPLDRVSESTKAKVLQKIEALSAPPPKPVSTSSSTNTTTNTSSSTQRGSSSSKSSSGSTRERQGVTKSLKSRAASPKRASGANQDASLTSKPSRARVRAQLKEHVRNYEEKKRQFEDMYPTYEKLYTQVNGNNEHVMHLKEKWKNALDAEDKESLAREIRLLHDGKKNVVKEAAKTCTEYYGKLTELQKELNTLSDDISRQFAVYTTMES